MQKKMTQTNKTKMWQQLSLGPFLPFILVRNISPTLNETSAKEMLSQLFAQKTELFGVPEQILIGLPVDGYIFDNDVVNSLRAFVKYEDNSIHGRVALYFDNTLSFGRNLKMDNIVVDNFRSPQLRAKFVVRDFFEYEEDAGFLGKIEMHGYDCYRFSNLSFLIDLSTPIDIGSNNNDCNSNQISSLNANASHENDNSLIKLKSIEKSLQCLRCFKSFGSNKCEFESHIRQCKYDDLTSMSRCIRQAICSICQYKFLQTSTENICYLPCGHILHTNCFNNMKNLNETNIISCPNCKENIPQEWIGRIKIVE